MRKQSDNPLARWIVYNGAWWIVKRRVRQRQRQIMRRVVAIGVIGAVIFVGLALTRPRRPSGGAIQMPEPTV